MFYIKNIRMLYVKKIVVPVLCSKFRKIYSLTQKVYGCICLMRNHISGAQFISLFRMIKLFYEMSVDL